VDFDATEMVRIHRETKAILTMAAVEQADTARFGALDVTSDGCVCGFREKAASAGAGLINAGVYLMQPELLNYIAEGSVVSLEQTVFPNLLSAGEKIAVAKQRGDFFDIGTPDSLQAFVEYCRVVDSKSPESVPQ
jgi:mannose-1-phosphate guanylyltransferase